MGSDRPPLPPSHIPDYAQLRQDAVWSSLIFGGEPGTAAPPGVSVVPVLISIREWSSNPGWRERGILSRAIAGHIRGILLAGRPGSGCVCMDEAHYLALLPDAPPPDALEASCRSIVSICERELASSISCCIGTACTLGALTGQAGALRALADANIADLPIQTLQPPALSARAPNAQMDLWSQMLLNERFDPLLNTIYRFFQKDGVGFCSAGLLKFNQDFLQMLYSSMAQMQIPAHILFQRTENAELCRTAPDSIAKTVTWIFCAVTALSSHLDERRRSETYTEQARAYIQAHLCQDFPRQALADQIHLSQNHLARLFRQEVGMSISEYILQERMKLAFELLRSTALPVGEIAERVGYENYSYFLTLFRRVTGMTPSSYRARCTGCDEREIPHE